MNGPIISSTATISIPSARRSGVDIERLNNGGPQLSWRMQDIRVLVLPTKRKGVLVDIPMAHVSGAVSIPPSRLEGVTDRI